MKSLKFKIVALSVVVFAIFVGLISFLFFEIFRQRQIANFDLNLFNHAVDLATSIDINLLGDIVVSSPGSGKERKIIPFSLGSSIVQLRDLRGQVVIGSPSNLRPMPFEPGKVEEVLKARGYFHSFRLGSKDYRAVLIPVRRPPFEPLILQVASSTQGLSREQDQIRLVTLMVFGISIFAVGGVSFWTVRQSLFSVYRIINSARALEAHSLSVRLPLPEESELRELVVALNELLDRVRNALQSQEQFSADASHQLKTPLAVMRAELDIFKNQSRTPEETSGLIVSLSSDLKRLSDLVDNLLLMARFDSGAQSLQLETIRMDELIMEVLAQLQFFANEKKVLLHFEIENQTPGEELEIQADGNLVKILLFNIIENAIKHSGSNQAVHVIVSADEKTMAVSVQDEGSGIDPGELGRIFDRFHRVGSRQHEVPGVGLGLSIAKKIADLHQSVLSVESSLGIGTTFTWEIKKI